MVLLSGLESSQFLDIGHDRHHFPAYQAVFFRHFFRLFLPVVNPQLVFVDKNPILFEKRIRIFDSIVKSRLNRQLAFFKPAGDAFLRVFRPNIELPVVGKKDSKIVIVSRGRFEGTRGGDKPEDFVLANSSKKDFVC